MNQPAHTAATAELTPIILLDDGETWGGPGYVAFIDTDAVDAEGGDLPDSLPAIALDFSWSEEDARAAAEEGWGLFSVHGSGHYPEGALDIQKIDEAEIFHEDPVAIAHVFWKATTGSALHRRALMHVLFQPHMTKL